MPVYRNVLAKDGFRPPAVGIESCWDMFRVSAKKYPDNKMLGQREIVKGEAGNYVWLTYKQVYNIVLQIGASIRACGANQGARCGIFGPNCTKWVISMQACNAHGLYCVPLYDTLGSGVVEYIICHAEISIVFVEETKVSEVMRTFPSVSKHLKTLVSFGKITAEQKVVANRFGLAIYSWEEFLVLVRAYTTRVGSGPSPTEILGKGGDLLRFAGQEFGTTTGRPRRRGWLDVVALKYCCQINGFFSLNLTKLDVLSDLPEIELGVSYKTVDGTSNESFPGDLRVLEQLKASLFSISCLHIL